MAGRRQAIGYWRVVLLLMAIAAAAGCGTDADRKLYGKGDPLPAETTSRPPGLTGEKEMHVASTAFNNGEPIPSKYTCDGQDVSPMLAWEGDAPRALSQVVIVDDPDAPRGTFTHWTVYNIPPEVRELPEGASAENLPDGAAEGSNDFGRIGYGGPCPPPGKLHHYRFRVYALNIAINLKPGATIDTLTDEIADNIAAHGELVGTYRR